MSDRLKKSDNISERQWEDILFYLMKRVLPHVPAGQRLIKGEHHGVVLSVRLVAPLSDPAFVVCQRVMETPETVEERDSLEATIIH